MKKTCVSDGIDATIGSGVHSGWAVDRSSSASSLLNTTETTRGAPPRALVGVVRSKGGVDGAMGGVSVGRSCTGCAWFDSTSGVVSRSGVSGLGEEVTDAGASYVSLGSSCACACMGSHGV